MTTPQQQKIRQFIFDYQAQHGTRPTIHEIMEALGITSTSVVSRSIGRLRLRLVYVDNPQENHNP